MNLYGLEAFDLDKIDLAALTAQLDEATGANNDIASNSICPSCAQEMERTADHDFRCAECGHLEQATANLVKSAPNQARLRMVGPANGYFQRGIDRGSTTEYCEVQRRQVLAELLAKNRLYVNNGGRQFPDVYLEETAALYNQVQRHHVLRSQTKQAILAAILFYVCIKHEYIRARNEIVEFVGLQGGLARGTDFLRGMVCNGQLALDLDQDSIVPHIKTTFMQLGLPATNIDQIVALVQIAEAKKIGPGSNRRSKVVAFVHLITGVPLEQVAKKCVIRINTLRRFLEVYNNYKSHFVQILNKTTLHRQHI